MLTPWKDCSYITCGEKHDRLYHCGVCNERVCGEHCTRIKKGKKYQVRCIRKACQARP